jgi:hypothetical protein
MALTALGALGISAGAKALTGLGQMLFSGRKQAEPKYEIPQEVFRATQMAQEMAQTGMPEASRMMALQGAQQSALFGMRAAQDRRGGLMSIGNIQAGLDRSNLSIAAQDASMRQQNQRFAIAALENQRIARDKLFANQFQSYMNKEQQRRALIGAGIQNLAGSADTFAAGYLQNQYTNALLGKDTDNILGRKLTPIRDRIPITGALARATRTSNMTPTQLPSNMVNTGGNFLWGNP